jgi:hypothetical protein
MVQYIFGGSGRIEAPSNTTFRKLLYAVIHIYPNPFVQHFLIQSPLFEQTNKSFAVARLNDSSNF